MARLRTVHGHVVTLPPRRVSIGESAANEIPIAVGHGLAAVHFRLQPWESGHFLEDAGSGLGTLVNARPVSWAPLKHGDVITAGDMRMVYEIDEGGAMPEFPAQRAPAADAKLAAEPGNVTEEASPAAGLEAPPAWLPPEALQPPVPPWARPSPQAPVSSGNERAIFIFVLILLLTAVALWYYARGR